MRATHSYKQRTPPTDFHVENIKKKKKMMRDSKTKAYTVKRNAIKRVHGRVGAH